MSFGWVRKGRQGFRGLGLKRFLRRRLTGSRGLDELLWDVGKGAASTRKRVCSSCFSYLFFWLCFIPTPPTHFFCFLLIWIFFFCYQGMLSFRLSLRKPWTVNESYKHLITGLVLHEAEKRGVAFPGHIPHSLKSLKVKYYCSWRVSHSETLSSISHLQHTNQID